MLADAGAAVDAKGTDGATPMGVAAHQGHTSTVVACLEKGADADLRDGFGGTAACCAARQGHAAIVRILAEDGANLTLGSTNVDHEGMNPLWEAVVQEHLDVVHYLANLDDVNVDCHGMGQHFLTPLWQAVRNHWTAGVKVLCAAGAQTGLMDNNGFHVTWLAAYQGVTEIVRTLCRAGADFQVHALPDEAPETPLEAATRANHPATVELLTDLTDAGTWGEYIARERAPYVLLRAAVARDGAAIDIESPYHDDLAGVLEFVFGGADVDGGDNAPAVLPDDLFPTVVRFLRS